MKNLLFFFASLFCISFTACQHKIVINSMHAEPNSQTEFACKQLKLAVSEHDLTEQLKTNVHINLSVDTINLSEQEYYMTSLNNGNIDITGGDETGLMYGALEFAQKVKIHRSIDFPSQKESPYIKKRGLKFNFPLDKRAPSHDDSGTAAQTNIANVWDFSFWQEYLDLLAIQQYNVLSLWNQHPFSSMVKLTDYPDAALQDVYNNEGMVKKISIDEKIKFWQKVIDTFLPNPK